MSVDPFQSKYPGLSAYSYTANNPILFIDPNGKEILIYVSPNSDPIVYKPGMGVPAEHQGNKFVTDAINTLNFINEDKFGSDMVSLLVTDKAVTTIYQAMSFNDNSNGYPNYKNNSNTITWDNTAAGLTNGTNPLTGSNVRPPASILFHEMVHRYLWLKGKNIEDALFNVLKGLNNTPEALIFKGLRDQGIQSSEDLATSHREDIIIEQFENPFNLRSGYGIRLPSSPFIKYSDAHEIGEKSSFKTENPIVSEAPVTDPVLELKK